MILDVPYNILFIYTGNSVSLYQARKLK